MSPTDLAPLLAEHSRELCAITDETGTLVWVDERARRHGFAMDARLSDLVVPGCEAKATELLRRGARDGVSRWELPLVLHGKPVTVLFAARPHADGIALLGSLVAQDYADAVAEGNRAVHEIVELNRELARRTARLEESNTAIRALHGELAQQADRLRSSAEIKSRLVASVSHEFRTPLHSILGMARLLLSRADGTLSSEQETQVRFIHESADELSRMINEMLDLARLDSGSMPLRTEAFALDDFLVALRATMSPLAPEDGRVALVFDPPPDVVLETDRGKLAQIVRNLVANALKFTERGEVRVTAAVDGDDVRVQVADTGIGIAPEDQRRVFDEFARVDGPLQRATPGTGLGLSLANKLAASLGGCIELASEPYVGSTFTLVVPREHAEIAEYRRIEDAAQQPDPARAPVLVVEDDRSAVFVYERYLSMAGFQVLPCRDTTSARAALTRVRPSAILLDVMLEGEDTWNFLAEVKRDPATRDVPVLVCTVMNRESRARALGADEFWLKPIDQDRLIRKLQSVAMGRNATVLVIDDEPAARYLIRHFLTGTPYRLLEAADGATGIALAQSKNPDVILLDFLLEETTAFDVIDGLKADPRTRLIPVIIVTSQVLPIEDRRRLSEHTEAILSKEHLSRELAINRIRDALRSAGVREREVQERA